MALEVRTALSELRKRRVDFKSAANNRLAGCGRLTNMRRHPESIGPIKNIGTDKCMTGSPERERDDASVRRCNGARSAT